MQKGKPTNAKDYNHAPLAKLQEDFQQPFQLIANQTLYAEPCLVDCMYIHFEISLNIVQPAKEKTNVNIVKIREFFFLKQKIQELLELDSWRSQRSEKDIRG